MAVERILVIRLGALGDLVLCFQAFHDIRQRYPRAEIALLTMPAYAEFAHAMPWFDTVIEDSRPSAWNVGAWTRLVHAIRRFNPTRVFDLQGKFRQSLLYMALGGPWGPAWSGAAPFCAHPRPWPPVPKCHFTDFIAAQLRGAGVPLAGKPDLAWLDERPYAWGLPERYALFIPGCSPQHPGKRWPAEKYAALANRLRARGVAVAMVGTAQEARQIARIVALAPHVIDLSGRTTLRQLASLARRSLRVVGNNTGPTHLAAAVGAPTLALMSEKCAPLWSAPRGPRARWLQGKPLTALEPEKVYAALTAAPARRRTAPAAKKKTET